MPQTPQEILADPKFQGLPLGDQLTVMRNADPNFAGLSKTDQGTVIARARQKFLGTDKIGYRLADDPNMGTPEPSMEPGLPGQPSKDFIGGAKDIASGNLARGAHEIITGAGKVGSMALPVTLAAAPAATALGLAGGYAGSKLGHGAAKALGASDDVSNLAGDVGGFLGGAGAAKVGGDFISGFREGWNAAGPQSAAKARGAKAAWRNFPTPANTKPEPFEPIPATATPSGRVPGGPSPQPASTAQKLPLWHMIRGQPVQSPAEFESIPSDLPSGRTPGPVTANNPTRTGPAWKAFPTPEDAVSAPFEPIRSQLPSGRKVGGIQNQGVTPEVQSAAELMKAVGIRADEAAKATPEQWQMIQQHVGSNVDRSAAIARLKEIQDQPIPLKVNRRTHQSRR